MKRGKCTVCDSEGHNSLTCPDNPKKRLTSTTSISPTGKRYQSWTKWKRNWKILHPPEYDETLEEYVYICGICNRPVLADAVTLDHIKPRSTHPHLYFDGNNIQPAHEWCNGEKGSTMTKNENKRYGRKKNGRL